MIGEFLILERGAKKMDSVINVRNTKYIRIDKTVIINLKYIDSFKICSKYL